MNCYCGSDVRFADCCQPFIDGKSKPPTAEILMRSRYSAYVLCDVNYLLHTTHPSTRKFHDRESIKNWAEQSAWQKLEVLSTAGGNVKDKKGTVEFKAYYLDLNSQPHVHYEHSRFIKELGKWFYVDGKVLLDAEARTK